MTRFSDISARLAIPAIAAPMFLVSGPELVIAACMAGVIGAFPTVNARTPDELEDWLCHINTNLSGQICPHTLHAPAPVAANIIVQHGNSRLKADLEVLCANPTEIVITSVGSPAEVVGPLHKAGALVFADVASIRHARRAVDDGVDGLILLSAGAGGQTGWANPFAFVRAVRQFFDGTVVLAGGISDGVAVGAAITLGADLAYLGTKFLATTESMAPPEHKSMVVASTLDDIVLTSAITGLSTNMLRPSLQAFGIDVDASQQEKTTDTIAAILTGDVERPRNWLNLWSAGHSTSGIHDIPTVADLVQRTIEEYKLTTGPRQASTSNRTPISDNPNRPTRRSTEGVHQ